MTEVVNCGGGHRTRLRIIVVAFGAPPAPVYKGGEEEAGPLGARQVWGVLLGLPSPSRIPLSYPEWERRKGRGVGKGKGAPPPPLVQFGLHGGGATSPWPASSSPLWPNKAHYFPRRIPVTPRYSDKIPESLGTIPMSEYSLPIYESLPLDHFETPRHVRDLIL